MKKWLVVLGLVGAFGIGSMTGGSVFSFASSNNGGMDTFPNGNNSMMNGNQSNMMGSSNGMGMMGNMSEMMDIMPAMGDMMDQLFSEAAKQVGMTKEQLQTELNSGKSLATIAGQQGVNLETVTKNLKRVTAEAMANLNQDNNLSDQAKQKLTYMTENVDVMLNAKGMFACNGLNK